MTAEDVKFTLDRLTKEGGMGDGQTSPRQSLLGPVQAVEVVDGNTVRFNLSEPWPILPAMLPFQEVVSKAFVEKVGPPASRPRKTAPGRSSWSSGARATRSSWSASTTITAARPTFRPSARPASTA